MATSIASRLSSAELEREQYRRERRRAVALITLLTPIALLLHGYHPYAEDGGIYVPEIKRLLDPSLFSFGSEFVVGHLRYSLFAPFVAGIVRESHTSLEVALLGIHLATVWITLFGAWLLTSRFRASREERDGAVALLTAWLTLPIGGTSLMLMDPYVTARSLATPCALLALVGALDFLLSRSAMEEEFEEQRDRGRRGIVLCCAALLGAVLMHPLMGAYALGTVLLLVTLMSSHRVVRVWGTWGLVFTAMLMATGVQLSAPAESAAYQRVMLTRNYWFLSEWRWFEWMGLVAPLLLLSAVAYRRGRVESARAGLTKMAVVAGTSAVVIAISFARITMTTHQVARLQPLRIFQLVYIVLILVLGAAMGERVLQRRVWIGVPLFFLLGGVMFLAERKMFPASKHLELPGGMSVGGTENGWEQAFVWVRRNTPKDAVFALDAQYTTKTGEDAQGFRAMAERSSLPDSKDGGTASNNPALTEEWTRGMALQTGLGVGLNAMQVESLKLSGASWVVLERGAAIRFGCAYEDDAVKICRLP